jgi:hypothetical protein
MFDEIVLYVQEKIKNGFYGYTRIATGFAQSAVKYFHHGRSDHP